VAHSAVFAYVSLPEIGVDVQRGGWDTAVEGLARTSIGPVSDGMMKVVVVGQLTFPHSSKTIALYPVADAKVMDTSYRWHYRPFWKCCRGLSGGGKPQQCPACVFPYR
jgi:hypothetical protein